jgi:hypothetical protein
MRLDRRLSIIQAWNVEILKRLRTAVPRKRPELWHNNWILHHDKSPAHKALCVKQFLAQKSVSEMERQPFSPALVPNVFLLFTEMKSTLKGRRSQDIEDIKKMTALNSIPQREFQKCFQQ